MCSTRGTSITSTRVPWVTCTRSWPRSRREGGFWLNTRRQPLSSACLRRRARTEREVLVEQLQEERDLSSRKIWYRTANPIDTLHCRDARHSLNMPNVGPGGPPHLRGPTAPSRRNTEPRQSKVVHSMNNSGCHNHTKGCNKTQYYRQPLYPHRGQPY